MNLYRFALAAFSVVCASQVAANEQQYYSPRPLPECGSDTGIDCVRDGGTFWLSGRKVRIAEVVTPENPPLAQCDNERQAAKDATQGLIKMVSDKDLWIEYLAPEGDRWIAKVKAGCGERCSYDVAQSLVESELALWPSKPKRWCGL